MIYVVTDSKEIHFPRYESLEAVQRVIDVIESEAADEEEEEELEGRS